MTLHEYLEKRNGLDRNQRVPKVISRQEGRIFGLDITKSGWADHDFLLTVDQITSAIRYVQKAEHLKPKVKSRINALTVDNQEFGSRKLYLMQNSQGMFKIGISVDPAKRARTLTNSSGYSISVVAAWLIFDAIKEESSLHKIFKKYRKHGEWFDKPDLSAFEIEIHLTQSAKRLNVIF